MEPILVMQTRDFDGCNDDVDSDPVNPGPDVDSDGVVGGCDANDNDAAVQ